MDFQGSEMPRPNDTCYARNLKRRRLSDNFVEDLSPSPLALSSPVLEQHEYADHVVRGEEETQVHCDLPFESDVEASAGTIRDDGWSECCYGMVGSCINSYNVTFLITFSSCQTSMCDSDILQASRSPNCFPLPFEPQILFPLNAMD